MTARIGWLEQTCLLTLLSSVEADTPATLLYHTSATFRYTEGKQKVNKLLEFPWTRMHVACA